MLSKTVVEIPVLLIQSTFMYLITCVCWCRPSSAAVGLPPTSHPPCLTGVSRGDRYWLTGLNANFGALVLITALLGSVAAATALVLGAIAESVQAAMQLMPIAFLPQLVRTRAPVPVVCRGPRRQL